MGWLAWGAGASLLIALLAIAVSLAVGNGQLATRIGLFVMLTPGLALFSMWTASIVRRPLWFRSAHRVADVAFMIGSVLVLAPILLFLPWAPDRFSLWSMPFGLPLLTAAGLVSVAAGALVAILLRVIHSWRKRDYLTVASGLFGLTLFCGLIGVAISRMTR